MKNTDKKNSVSSDHLIIEGLLREAYITAERDDSRFVKKVMSAVLPQPYNYFHKNKLKLIFLYPALSLCIVFILFFLSSFQSINNHPSFECQPSNEDIIFTKKIDKCASIMGLNFLDHIIVSQNEYFSFKKEGML